MDENMLWEKFCANGKVTDYLEYRNCINSMGKSELELIDKDNGIGARDKGTEYRRVR